MLEGMYKLFLFRFLSDKILILNILQQPLNFKVTYTLIFLSRPLF